MEPKRRERSAKGARLPPQGAANTMTVLFEANVGFAPIQAPRLVVSLSHRNCDAVGFVDDVVAPATIATVSSPSTACHYTVAPATCVGACTR